MMNKAHMYFPLDEAYSVGEGVNLGREVRVHEKSALSHCRIGDYCLIGPHVEIHNGVILGKGVKLFNFVNLYGCRIGDNTKIGAFVEIQNGAVVGANCKISSHSFLCEGVVLEDEVFIGHGVRFINDPFPRATTDEGTLKTDNDWAVIPTIIHRRASIGSGAVLLCGICIGEEAIIGAGAVVTRNVPDRQIWVGNPARYLKATTT